MKFAAAAALPLLALAGLASAIELPTVDPAADPATAEEGSPKGFLTGSLLPDGSVLENVTLPNYDEKLHLKASMLAKHLILHDKQNVEAQSLTIDFFSQGRKPSGTIQLESATYSDARQILRSDRPFTLISEKLNAIGTGLIYDVKSQRGFVNGPVTADASLQPVKDTAMNTSPTFNSLAIGVAMIAAGSFAEAAPANPATPSKPAAEKTLSAKEALDAARPTPAELAKLAEQAKSALPLATGARGIADQKAVQAAQDSVRAHDALAEFAAHVALTTLATANPLAGDTPGEVPAPPELTGQKTHITADDGVFMDREKGILVFIRNVVVKDEASVGQLSGADELKILFKQDPNKETAGTDGKGAPGAAKTPADPNRPAPSDEELQHMKEAKQKAAEEKSREKEASKDKPAPKKDTGDFSGSMGDVERVIATGKAVVLTRKGANPGDKDVQASGRIVIYEPDTKELLIKGGSPWVVSEKATLRVTGENGYIRYNTETGDAVSGGGQASGDALLKQSTGPAKDHKPKAPKPAPPANKGH